MPESIIPAAVSSQLDNTGEERIHVANIIPGGIVRTPWVAPPVPVENIFLAYSGQTYFRYSNDSANLDYTNTVETGGFVGSDAFAQRVHSVNGRLFRTGTGSNAGRTSTDGLNYVAMTGTNFVAGSAVESCFWTGTEFIFLQASSATATVSTDGVLRSARAMGVTAGSGRGAQMGAIIVADRSTNNNVIRSIDSGVTWGAVAMGGSSMGSMHATRSANRFLVFGRDIATENNVMKWSTTGAVGTWTSVTLPGGFSAQEIQQSCWNEDTGRLIVVRRDRATYYSDNEGDTWTLGATVPGDSAYTVGTTGMRFANGKVYYMKPDNSGLDTKLYETTDGTAWTEIFSEFTWGGDPVTNFDTFLFP